MSKINLNPGDSIVTKNQNGMKGIPVDARTQVQYYKDIQNIEYAYENLQVIVTNDDPTDLQHPKGIYVITKLDANNNVDISGIKSLKETVNVTKQDVGLGNVDNTSDANKPISTATQQALNDKQPIITDLDKIRSGACAGATAYQKPSDGIPSTALTSAVQTSLGKADSAIQGITKGGTTLTPNANKIVDIPEEIETVVANDVAAGCDPTATLVNGTLTLGIPRGVDGADAVNPFKGWYDAVVTGEAGSRVITCETQNLPASPVKGDYAYVKTWDISGTPPSQTEKPIARIYECTTAGTWSDSGRTVDTSSVQTFKTGEPVNEVGVDNEPTTGSNNLVKSRGVYNSTPRIANSSAESDLDFSDEQGNVLMRLANGNIQVKNFSSVDILDSIQAILSNVGFDNVPEFSEEEDYGIGDIVRHEKYVYVFTNAHTAGEWDETEAKKTVINTEHPIEVADGTSESDLDISDENGNVLVRFENGHFKVKNFSSADALYSMFLANVSACKYSGNLMHISFDDTSLCLNSLFGQPHKSIYDVTFFSNLKTLHDTYGACFSCYVYVESLANVNNNYATEFQAAKDWLKWNFHTLNNKQYNDNTPINSDYDLGISRLLTMVGNDKECLDHQMRGNYWELSLANAEYVRDNTTHSSYIFCAKDPFSPSSGNYYLDNKQKAFVFNNGFLIDTKNRVLFVQTCARLDDEEKTLASKRYITTNLKWQKSCEVLNHEWAFDNNRMSVFLDWAKNTMDFKFGFFDNIYKF